MSSAELVEWMAYYQLEPWGDHMADHRHGVLCSLLHNGLTTMISGKPPTQNLGPIDFMTGVDADTKGEIKMQAEIAKIDLALGRI